MSSSSSSGGPAEAEAARRRRGPAGAAEVAAAPDTLYIADSDGKFTDPQPVTGSQPDHAMPCIVG